jgi:DNA-binding NarL/FixJ family response regulator
VTIRVFVLDDHEVVRRGLKVILEADDDLRVVGEAATAEAALSAVPSFRPDVAILDIHLPDGDGVAVCRSLRSATPELRCLMLTGYADDKALLAAVAAGASGYVLKEVGGDEIVTAIRRVAAGESLFTPALIRQAKGRVSKGKFYDERLAELTPRQRAVVELIAEGKSNAQIAEELSLTHKTVKNMVSNLLHRMGFSSRAQVAVYVARLSERWQMHQE